ncbi:MAG TPA: YqeG family HAD IIIA-type phosphatase [Syntrophomonadaceae bacterium]|jgi:HAD superfamily phosphatase (TIGR01668 family)|nr:YqeG family HAD IIIA-type phosphatase [Syntrophomonadaceae bacterium]
MSSRLYPCLYVNSLLDIPLEDLEQFNIKAFILDLDNTVTEWNSNKITQEVQEWFQQIKEADFRACILSNNDQQRIVKVAEKLDIPYISRARKPRRGAFYRAITLMGVEPNETAVIGDQIFTDVLGGNRAGLFTILVRPINRREFVGTKISRFAEFFVLRRLYRSRKPGKLYPR